jgi:hypothetical protein
MAEVTQYTFSWAEVAEVLIKKQDLHEGEWIALLEFGVSPGLVGPTPAEAKPGMSIVASGVQLVRAQPGAPTLLVADAAKVNPKS